MQRKVEVTQTEFNSYISNYPRPLIQRGNAYVEDAAKLGTSTFRPVGSIDNGQYFLITDVSWEPWNLSLSPPTASALQYPQYVDGGIY